MMSGRVVTCLLALGLASHAGCSACTSGSTADAGADAAAQDGGCVSPEPAEGDACNEGQTVCQTGDPCCIGYAWSCDGSSHTWRRYGLGCACRVDAGAIDAGLDAGPDAGAFVCGNLICTGTEYCKQSIASAPPPDGGPQVWNECIPIPAACTPTPTCECLRQQGVACTCKQNGPMFVTCYVP